MATGVTDIDRGWKKLIKEMRKAGSAPYAKVGVIESSGASEDREGLTMAGLAAVHEYGSPKQGIPPRSFIYATFDKKEREQATVTTKLAKKVYTGVFTVEHALGLLGIWGEEEVRGAMRKGLTPQVSAKRRKQKEVGGKDGSKPLIHTSRLLGAIGSQVVK